MEPAEKVRIDKWLWAVRLYKSRSMAAEACLTARVQISGQPIKPSRCIKVGDVITAQAGDIQKRVRVRALLEKRVGAKLVSQFYEDHTPASEYSKPREKSLQPFAFRPKGSGRPTKKQRRSIQAFLK